MIQVVQVVQVVRMIRVVRVVRVVKWSGDQVAGVVRVRVSLDDMLQKKIWFLCPKSSNN